MKKIISIILIALILVSFVSANRILYKEKDTASKTYAIWAKKILDKTPPFNEKKWVITQYRHQIYKGDFLVEVKDLNKEYGNYYGLAYFPNSTNGGRIFINPNSFDVVDQRFLLLHELGHAYSLDHSNDGSMMDHNGGDAKYKGYQVNKIRSYL